MSNAHSFHYDECPQPRNRAMEKNSFKRLKGPILASLATSAGSFAIGNVLSWTSVALPDLKSSKDLGELTSEQESWIGSVVALGALVAGPLTGISLEKWGRKYTLLGINFPLLMGWLMIVFSTNVTLTIVGRFFTGFGIGCLTLVIPVYITECTEERLRGVIASSFPILWAVGVLTTSISGALKISWFWLSIFYSFPPIILLLCMIFVPETPLFYIRSGRDADALNSLKWLRSASDSEVQPEFEILMDSVSDSRDHNNGNASGGQRFKLQNLFQRSVLKPAIISIMLFVFQQFSGFNAVVFYMVDIFDSTGSGMDSNVSAVIVNSVFLLGVCITSSLTDKLGRRLLLLISSTGITIALTALGVFFYLKEQNEGVAPDNISWLPLASLLFFMMAFSAGMGPMPFLLMGEILPSHVKGLLSSIGISLMWFLAFLITKTFDGLSQALGAHGCFWMFAGVSALGLVFSFILVKETKGKTLDQIYKMYS